MASWKRSLRADGSHDGVVRLPATVANRVPRVTALFWILKLLTTGSSETASGILAKQFDPASVVLIAPVIFAASFVLKISVARYTP